MTDKETKKISKFLSLILRHNPAAVGIELDHEGWANVAELITKINAKKGWGLTVEQLDHVVATNNKKRFAYSQDGRRIRANQGHSIQVDLGLEAVDPPAILYHGTATRFLDSIMEQGLISKSRQHVHLSWDIETATTVGKRHGKVVILQIDCANMLADGHLFYLSENNVWLTDHVPVKYIALNDKGS